MQYLSYKNLAWTGAPGPEITKAEIARDAAGGGVAFWSVSKGSGFSHHSHKGYEYIYLVKGHMDFSGVSLREGDFLLTSEGEEHGAMALEDSVILVINERKNS